MTDEIGKQYQLYSHDYEIGGPYEFEICSRAPTKNGAEAYLASMKDKADLSNYGLGSAVTELILSVRHQGVRFGDVEKEDSIWVNIFSVQRGLFGRLIPSGRRNLIAIGNVSKIR